MKISVVAPYGPDDPGQLVGERNGRLVVPASCIDDDGPLLQAREPVRRRPRRALRGEEYRTEPLADQWELYDLTDDPIERVNRWRDDERGAVFEHLRTVLKQERARSVPERNVQWP